MNTEKLKNLIKQIPHVPQRKAQALAALEGCVLVKREMLERLVAGLEDVECTNPGLIEELRELLK